MEKQIICPCGHKPKEIEASEIYIIHDKQQIRIICGNCKLETVWDVSGSEPKLISQKEIYVKDN